MEATPLREKPGTEELDPDGCMGYRSSSVLGKCFGPTMVAPWRPELMRSTAVRTKGDAKVSNDRRRAWGADGSTYSWRTNVDLASKYVLSSPAYSVLQSNSKGLSGLRRDTQLPQQGALSTEDRQTWSYHIRCCHN